MVLDLIIIIILLLGAFILWKIEKYLARNDKKEKGDI